MATLMMGQIGGCGGTSPSAGDAGSGGAAGPSNPGEPTRGSGDYLDCPDGSQLELPEGDCVWAVCGTDDVVSVVDGENQGDIGSSTGFCTKETPGFVALDPEIAFPGVNPPVMQLVA
jgi:hypothetical protein